MRTLQNQVDEVHQNDPIGQFDRARHALVSSALAKLEDFTCEFCLAVGHSKKGCPLRSELLHLCQRTADGGAAHIAFMASKDALFQARQYAIREGAKVAARKSATASKIQMYQQRGGF